MEYITTSCLLNLAEAGQKSPETYGRGTDEQSTQDSGNLKAEYIIKILRIQNITYDRIWKYSYCAHHLCDI